MLAQRPRQEDDGASSILTLRPRVTSARWSSKNAFVSGPVFHPPLRPLPISLIS